MSVPCRVVVICYIMCRAPTYYLAKTSSGLKITILIVEAHVTPGDGTWPTSSHPDVPFEGEGKFVAVKHAARILRMPNIINGRLRFTRASSSWRWPSDELDARRTGPACRRMGSPCL